MLRSLRIKDDIYGSFKIDEPVLRDLLKSKALKRLKGINNGGYYPAEEIVRKSPTRYAHSVGVFLLLRRYGASLKEQIAGLIHDASHSAFSHTIDYIVSEKGEEQKKQLYQDTVHLDVLGRTDIHEILEKHGFSLEELADESRFSLLEQPSPALCADRIDYFLRTFPLMYPKKVAGARCQYVLSHLIVSEGVFAFDDVKAASWFAQLFNWTDARFWSSEVSAVMFGYGGLLFRKALQKGLLTLEDFYMLSDKQIISRLKKSKELQPFLEALKKKARNHSGGKFSVVCKVRSIDPLVALKEMRAPLSKILPEYAATLERRGKERTYLLKQIG